MPQTKVHILPPHESFRVVRVLPLPPHLEGLTDEQVKTIRAMARIFAKGVVHLKGKR